MACLMARFICSSEVEIGFDCMPHEQKRRVQFLKVFGRQPEQQGGGQPTVMNATLGLTTEIYIKDLDITMLEMINVKF